jgi:uncharacterized membrane protein YgdD (TMEM256/DUF423 family)
MKYTIALLGITAVVLGAFGAHGLKDLLEPTAIQSYKTAVSYHLIHTVAILALYNSTGSVAQSVYGLSVSYYSPEVFMH